MIDIIAYYNGFGFFYKGNCGQFLFFMYFYLYIRVHLIFCTITISFPSGKVIMHDPFAMRPFFGYNFGDYLAHWVSMQNRKAPTQLPKIFHVNWFRKDPSTGSFLWPGFGENARVLEWIFKRCSRESEDQAARKSIIGWLPVDGAINTKGLSSSVDMGALFDVPKAFWQKETKELRAYFTQQVGADLPAQVEAELKALEDRVHQ